MAASIDPRTESPSSGNASSQARLSALPAAQLWHASAPGGLKGAWKSDPHGDAWRRVGKLLEGRRLPKTLLPAGKKRPAALEWGADASLDGWRGWREDLLKRMEVGASDQLTDAIQQWSDRSHRRDADPAFALECLSWASQLPTLAQSIDSETWWRLVEHLHEIALQTFEVSLGEEPSADIAYAHQTLGGELPLVLCRLLGEVEPLRGLRKLSSRVLTEGVLALTDGEGLATARVLPRLPLLLACWTRCRTWAENSGKPCWSSDAETQYEWMVRQTLRLARPDGALALTPQTVGAAALLDQALNVAGDVSDHAAAANRLGVKAYGQVAGKADPPEPSVNSEWSGIAVLSAGWGGKSQRATITYDGASSRLEYAAAGKTLISGEWKTEIVVDGKTLAADDTWDEQCWYTDDDCDYLELSLDLTHGAQLVRQFVLAREDRVAYLADIVLSGKSNQSRIEVTQRLPLAKGVKFSPEKQTREGWLKVNDKPTAGVVPAGLPEWRTDPRIGELTQEEGCLVLRHEWTGRNVCCPLFLDAAPNRFDKQRTWRQLTVAHALEKVSPDVAVGFRYQSGKEQWIAYRSLDAQANRTVLGHNLSSEALFGRFLGSGEVDEFFEIEDE